MGFTKSDDLTKAEENFIVHFVKISLFFSLSIFPAFFILFFVGLLYMTLFFVSVHGST